jgi:iron uptake system component EfeO
MWTALRHFVPVLAVALSALAACSSDGGPKAVAVTSTASECQVEQISFSTGKLRFAVTNKGEEPTELYVYGDGDKVIGEVENVGPGTTRTLKVSISKPGRYELACKPGMKGKGIRQPITVSG